MTNLSKKLVLLLTCSAVAFASFLLAKSLDVRPVTSLISGANWQPFAMIVRETGTDYSSGRTVESKSFYAVRSDGANVKGNINRYADGNEYSTWLIKDRQAGRITLVSEAVGAITTESIPDEFRTQANIPANDPTCGAFLAADNSDGGGWRAAGTATLHGISAVRFAKTTQEESVTVLRAPALNCSVVSLTREEYGPDGQLVTKVDRRAESITIGSEAVAHYFAIPDDYVEMSPVERQRAISDRFEDGVLPSCALKSLFAHETRYWESRQEM